MNGFLVAAAVTVARCASSATAGDVTALAVSPVIEAPAPPRARRAMPVESPTYSGSPTLLTPVADGVSTALALSSVDRSVQSLQPEADLVCTWRVT